MHKKWLQEAENLENDFDNFRDYFNRNKRCGCHIDECIHFDRSLSLVLGERAGRLCKFHVYNGFRTYYDLVKNNK